MLRFNLILGLDYIFLFWGGVGGGVGVWYMQCHNEFETKESNIILIEPQHKCIFYTTCKGNCQFWFYWDTECIQFNCWF